MQKNQVSKPEKLRYHQYRIAVTREFGFEAAHRLYDYQGPCKNLHGHSYRLLITISGYPDENGFVIDFKELKELFGKAVKNRLDHSYLNEVLPQMNTTVENVIVWIWRSLDETMKQWGWDLKGLRLEELTLYETISSAASLKRNWMENMERS